MASSGSGLIGAFFYLSRVRESLAFVTSQSRCIFRYENFVTTGPKRTKLSYMRDRFYGRNLIFCDYFLTLSVNIKFDLFAFGVVPCRLMNYFESKFSSRCRNLHDREEVQTEI